MPIDIVRKVFAEGLDSVPFVTPVLKAVPWLGGVVLLKRYFGGARNPSERDMHGKVVLITVSLVYLLLLHEERECKSWQREAIAS